MPRTKKTEEIKLTENEVWDIVQFARGLSNGVYSGILTPDLVSSRMKDITLNPLAATEESLNAAIADPKNSELQLQEFSQSFELKSQPYKRLISFLGNLLSFDLTYTCKNATYEDYKTDKYKKDLDIVYKFLDNFDYRKEFSVAVKEMLRNEAYFCSPRLDGEKFVLQELPSSPTYTRIDGRWDYGLLFSFNMYWFINPGISLDSYPMFFRKKYMELWGENKGIDAYKPFISPDLRGQSSWVYWQDIPPDVGWCFKLNPEIATRVPYFTPLFNDLLLQSLMRTLQKNINMAAASKMIFGQVPLLKDAAKASVKDMIAINPDLLGKFLSLVKSAISDSIKIASAPLEELKAISFESDNDMYNSYLKTTLALSGVNTNLVFTSDVKPNLLETELSLNTDEQLMYSVYPQFSSFMEYQVNKMTKKFKFKFEFEGSKFSNNRQKRFEMANTLADKGIVLPQKFAAAIGMPPHDFQRQLDEARAMGWTENLTPIIPAFQMSPDKGGAPKKSSSDLSETGQETRETGSNLTKGGKL